jgi:hemerythrin-like domain-containing protein
MLERRRIMTDHTHDHAHHLGHGGTPTQVLMAEHELILQALDALEKKVAAVQAGAAPDRTYFEKAVEFLRGFADKCHHGKEEELLFKRMADRGFPLQGGPIAVMLNEHDMGRAFIKGIADGAAEIGSDPGAAKRVTENAQGYIDLLRNHIGKENNVLFPMADRVLSAEDQADLGMAFEKFEGEEMGAGVHEVMLKLLQELKV